MKNQHFTILELLLVISIAAILLTTALPAFNRMLKGSASGIAMRELVVRLSAARSKAMSKSNETDKYKVAVVFPSDSDTTNINFQKKFNYQAYRTCYVEQHTMANGKTTLKFKSWIGDWKFLPDGIIIGWNTRQNKNESFFYAKNISKNPGAINEERYAQTSKVNYSCVNESKIIECEIGGRSFGLPTEKGVMQKFVLFNTDGTLDCFPNSILIKLRPGKFDGTKVNVRDSEKGVYFPVVVRQTGKMVLYNELVSD